MNKKIMGLTLLIGTAMAAPTDKTDTNTVNGNATIGYVDLQVAMQSVKEGQKAKDALQKEFAKKKQEVESKQEELRKLNEEFEKKSMVMSEKTRQEKQMDFQRKAVEFQQFVQQSQAQMQEREKELTAPILDEMKTIFKEIAKEKQLAMILEKNQSAVLYAPEENDYTELLIKKFESRKKK